MSSEEDNEVKVYRKGNPFRGVYIYNKPDELLEIAFSRAKKVSPKISDVKTAFERKKRIAIHRFHTFCDILEKRLRKLVRDFPSIEKIHPFYTSIMSIYVDIGKVKMGLGKIDGAVGVIERLRREYIGRIKALKILDPLEKSKVYNQFERLKKEAYGRVSSVIKSLKKEFKMLSDIVKIMKKIPDLDPTIPIVVVAGPPNTGKSSLVKAFSNAKVEIASYPFTTKNITFGVAEIKKNEIFSKKVQFVDTPGLFDRPLEEKKKEELLAISALKTIANLVIFLFDGSIEAALPPSSQLNIFREVLRTFENKDRMIIAINKVDIGDDGVIGEIEGKLKTFGFNDVFKISILKNIGLKELLNEVDARISS